MKRWAMAIAMTMVAACFLAGCVNGGGNGSVAPSDGSFDPFTLVNAKGQTISLDDSKNKVEKIFKSERAFVTEFTEEGVERHQYWNQDPLAPGEEPRVDDIAVDFEVQGWKVVALHTDSDEWKVQGSPLGMGSTIEEVVAEYGEANCNIHPQRKLVSVSLDKQKKAITYDENSPYILHYVVEKEKVNYIIIQKNS